MCVCVFIISQRRKNFYNLFTIQYKYLYSLLCMPSSDDQLWSHKRNQDKRNETAVQALQDLQWLQINVYRSAKICDHQRSSSMRALKTSSYSESLLLSCSSCRWGHRNYASAFNMYVFILILKYGIRWYIFSSSPCPLQSVVYVLSSHTTYCAAIDKLEKLVHSALIFFEYVVWANKSKIRRLQRVLRFSIDNTK